MAEEEQTEDTGYDVGKLEGVDKAAILLLSLTEDDAAQILKHLEPKQVQKLGQAMAQIDDMTQPKITAVHKHFIEEIQNYSTIGFQSTDFVKRALTSALGEDKAANLIDQILIEHSAFFFDCPILLTQMAEKVQTQLACMRTSMSAFIFLLKGQKK